MIYDIEHLFMNLLAIFIYHTLKKNLWKLSPLLTMSVKMFAVTLLILAYI